MGRQNKRLEWHFEGKCIRCTSHIAHPRGYVQYRVPGQGQRLARHILFKRYGKQPTSIVARHTCDHPWCINPDHIIPGTNKDNAHDAIERGQIARGSRLPQCKLSPEQVIEIRTLDLPQSKIAQRFGIGQSQVGNIKRRKWWKHIP
jgi:hypothetical protein